MRKVLFSIGCGLLLAGCVMKAPERPVISPIPSSSSGASSEALPVPGDIKLPEVSTGSLSPITERLLSGGILEIGETDAPLTLLVFTNLSSNYCQRFQQEHMPRLLKDFVEPGLLKLHIATLNLKKYPESDNAASLLHCGAVHGSGRTMLDLLANSPRITTANILAEADKAGMNVNELRACLEESSTSNALALQAELAKEHQVTLVPTFFLQDEVSVGLPEYADLRGWIQTTLKMQ